MHPSMRTLSSSSRRLWWRWSSSSHNPHPPPPLPPPAPSATAVAAATATPTERVDCVVIGAGVVGLAVARALAAQSKREVIVIEAASTFGTSTSSRNSEVIHAGLYYPSDSLKAFHCVQGRKALYSYCRDHEVPFRQLGKLIVATNVRQIPALESIQRLAKINGVEDLRMLSADEAVDMEPQLRCVKALLSPSTGILDSHSFMVSLQADAEAHGTTFSFNSAVTKGRVVPHGIELNVCSLSSLASRGDHFIQVSGESMILCANTVINAAGLSAVSIARRIQGFPAEALPQSFYARGCYFSLCGSGKAPFSHLIYPLPEEGGLGVHVTLDLGGQLRFGPDVEWLHDIKDAQAYKLQFDYTVDPNRAEKFYPEIQKYYPSLQDGALEPSYAGIRPKISGPRDPAADFLIQGHEIHGVPGLVNLFGIESPGLTASLSLAKKVHAMTL